MHANKLEIKWFSTKTTRDKWMFDGLIAKLLISMNSTLKGQLIIKFELDLIYKV